MSKQAKPRSHDGIQPYFGQSYHYLYKNFLLPEEQTGAETDFLLRSLKPRQGERWLDAPCGFGRHLLHLQAARPDLRLVGVDLAARFLREPQLHQSGRVVQADLRRLPLAAASCDAVINMFNSFGYYPPRGRRAGRLDDRAILAEWGRVLRSGGSLVMDLSNRRGLIETVRQQPVIRYFCGEIETTEQFDWDPASQCMSNRTRWRWPGGRESGQYTLRLYTPSQIGRLLTEAGFDLAAVFGSFSGSTFDPHQSDRMVLIAHKR